MATNVSELKPREKLARNVKEIDLILGDHSERLKRIEKKVDQLPARIIKELREQSWPREA